MGAALSLGLEESEEPGASQVRLANEVQISVYKLEITGIGFLDNIGSQLAGIYHTGLVVGNKEYAFGGHDEAATTGIYCTEPELNQDYTFHKRLIIGELPMSQSEAMQVIRGFARNPVWWGRSYDLVEHNCNHFVSDLLWALLRVRPPPWINAVARSMAKQRRYGARLEAGLVRAAKRYRRELESSGQAKVAPAALAASNPPGPSSDGACRPEHSQEEPAAAELGLGAEDGDPAAELLKCLPGAFEVAFRQTFEEAWRWRNSRPCDVPEQKGADEEALWQELEEDNLQFAENAASAVARAVGQAARLASAGRYFANGGERGARAWESSWATASASLQQKWRQQAINGNLDGDDCRSEQVRSALVAADAAAGRQPWEEALSGAVGGMASRQCGCIR